MKKTIYCPDIECESCVKVLTRVFSSLKGIKAYDIKNGYVLVDYQEKTIKPEQLLEVIRQRGYRAAFTPFYKKTFRERARDFVSNKHKYEVEHTLLRYVSYAFVLLILLEILAYFAFFRQDPLFFSKYAWWFLYATISVVAVGAAIWHFKAYKAEVTNMTGMMIGMTIGMSSGLLVGAILGATNGLFIGATVGMILACIVGWYAGKCCGIMGVLEGLMAGTMGAMMGAMITVMLMAEHLSLFMPVFVIIILLVLGGLSYMLFEEVVEDKTYVEKRPADFWTFFSYCFIFTLILIMIMLYGWKSAIVMVM